NSSTPPAQGHKANAPPPGRRGGGKAHAGAPRPLHPNPPRRRAIIAARCRYCRADVSGAGQGAKERYDRIETPQIQPEVTRVTLYGGVCPCCARPFKAAPPAGLKSGSPFGPNPRAAHALSYERLARLMSELLGVAIGAGALVTIMADSHPAFARPREAIRARRRAGTVLAADETSMRVGQRTWWNWVFDHADSACFVLAPSRGRALVAQFLGQHRPAFWVSDRLATQRGWATKAHQVCLAHLIRAAQYAIAAGDTVFAPGVQKRLRQACAIGRRRDRLSEATLRTYAAKLKTRRDTRRRAAPTHRQGEKLRAVIKKYRQNVFVFVTNRTLPPTNNGSALRQAQAGAAALRHLPPLRQAQE
ncbi:MAG: IS66 family transposase, partial [Stellaceae bacterium]